jgi:hypothetical protein
MKLKDYTIAIVLSCMYLILAIFSKLSLLWIYGYALLWWMIECFSSVDNNQNSVVLNLIVAGFFIIGYYKTQHIILRLGFASFASVFIFGATTTILNSPTLGAISIFLILGSIDFYIFYHKTTE